MWLLFFKLLISILITEAVTEIVVKSEIFNPFRKKIFDLGRRIKFFDWLHSLFECGYCFSVWSGGLIAFLLFRDIELTCTGLDWIFVGLFLHRSSNFLHDIMDALNRTR